MCCDRVQCILCIGFQIGAVLNLAPRQAECTDWWCCTRRDITWQLLRLQELYLPSGWAFWLLRNGPDGWSSNWMLLGGVLSDERKLYRAMTVNHHTVTMLLCLQIYECNPRRVEFLANLALHITFLIIELLERLRLWQLLSASLGLRMEVKSFKRL